MPDPIVMAEASGLAMLIAALAVGGFGRWGRRRPAGFSRIDAGWVVGVGIGYYAGCWLLGIRPRWPVREALDRLLVLVVPGVMLVELLAAVPRLPGWLIWTLRAIVAGLVARVLLHGSIYLSGEVAPGSLAWTPARSWMILGALAAGGAAAWALLAMLARRPAGASLPLALGIAIGGASVTIMLSGYLEGGQAGLPLSAAFLGGSAAALALRDASGPTAPVGLAIVGLSSLLVIGRFFGELRTDHAILLFAAPLLGWLTELPRLRRLPPWARGLLRVLLVGLVVSVVLADAARRFVAASGPAARPGAGAPTVDDYLNFGP